VNPEASSSFSLIEVFSVFYFFSSGAAELDAKDRRPISIPSKTPSTTKSRLAPERQFGTRELHSGLAGV
jgi:hypothetical protein